MNIAPLKISFSEEERNWILNRIDESLKRGELSQGRNVQELEEKFADYTGIKHAIAVNSGTSSIEIVMRILGVKGKEVLVPTNTFIATATGVLFAGGKVRLVDTDPKTMSICLDDIKKRVTTNTVGVIVVHIGGIISPEILEIKKWCDEQGLWLFEDAAHAHGSSLNDCHAGGFGIAGSYSFFATKIITSGEGGIIVTNNDELADKARLYRNHGKPKAWETYNTHIGSNWRMNDITAAIGLAQVDRLDDIITSRENIAKKYTSLLRELLPDIETILPCSRSSWYKYIVLLPKGVSRDYIKKSLKEKSIGLQGEVYGIPLHMQPVAKEAEFEGEFPNADDVCNRHICLPIYPSLTDEQVEKVVTELANLLK